VWFERECGLARNTITRSFKALADAGYSLRRTKRKASDRAWDTSETTLPIIARAWADLREGVGPEKSEGRSEKIGGRSEQSTTVGPDNPRRVRENTEGRFEKISLPSPNPWSDPRLLGWIDNEMAMEVFKTAEVAQLSATLAEGMPNELLRRLVTDEHLPLAEALATDAGLYALRTLVAGVIVARCPGDGGEVDVSDMVLPALKRVIEVIYCCIDDGPLASYAEPGAMLTGELWSSTCRIVVPPLAAEKQAGSPVSDEECEMLLAVANAVVNSGASAEKKLALISAAIKAAAC
jgi:hypothetical protein